MKKDNYDKFHALLLGLPGWRDPRSREAFVQGAFWGHPIRDRLNLLNENPVTAASNLLERCEEMDTPTEAGLSPLCALLAEIRKLVGSGGRRDAVIEELQVNLCQDTATAAAAREPGIVRVLFLAAEPSDAARIRVDAEYRAIDEQLRLSRHRDRIRLLKPILATRPIDINRALQEHRPDIIHFSGHGSGPAGIYLEDDSGQAKLATTSALTALMQTVAQHTRAVVLNACSTQSQAEAIVQHIDYAVGTRESITDTAATAFSKGFYQSLGARTSLDIEAAFRSGCSLIQLEGIPGHHIPMLYKRQESPLSCSDQN
jgi:hypothetical protein